MENKVKIELINKSRNKDKKAMDTLVLHYYETVGKKYIKKYPNKPNNQECAWRLCELSIEKYINEGLKSDITSYISAQFKRKYKEFQPQIVVLQVHTLVHKNHFKLCVAISFIREQNHIMKK